MRRWIWFACFSLFAADPSAQLARQAELEQKKGNTVLAYALLTQAATRDPQYWGRAEALRREAMAAFPPALSIVPAPRPAGDVARFDSAAITADERRQARELLPPPELADTGVRRDLKYLDNARYVYQQVAKEFDCLIIFDNEYQGLTRTRLELSGAPLKEALRYLQLATSTLVMPLDDQAFYVTNDTPQKRLERETNIAISIPVPDAVSPQEMVEYGTALRAVFNLQRIHADPGSRTIFIRDAISRVRPAVLQLYQLMGARAEVDLEIELMDVSSGTSTTLGMNPPTLFPVNNVGGYWQAARSLAGGVGSNFALAITGARLLASSSQSDSRTLFRTRIRASNQTPATAKIGQRYPIISAVIGNIPGFTSFEVPPQVQFEDLGLDLKVTPRIHGADEVSLEIETEFKTLGSESFNGVPTINNRKIASQVRLRAGEWAAVGGLLTADQARTLAGLAGSTSIPFLGFLLGNQTFETNRTQVLLVIKPRIVIPGAPVWATQEVYVGSEQRPLVPL